MRSAVFLTVAALAGACSKSSPAPAPVTQAEAETFAAAWSKGANPPCSEPALRELIDHAALGKRFLGDHSTEVEKQADMELERTQVGAKIVCSWQQGAEQYKLLRVHVVDGQPRPLFRRVRKDARTGLRAVAYDELMLGKDDDGKVHAIDIYSYITGEWLSGTLRSLTSATLDAADSPGDALAIAEKLKQARALQQQQKYADALALLDTLPPSVRKTRGSQLMRVAVSGQLSQDAYKAALDEVAKIFPDDPSTALVEVDGAFLRADYDAALRYIDIVDKALGGDAWQDALRAEALVHRNKPGDLERAKQRADAAIAADPDLAKGWWARVDVQLAQKQWAAALATLDEMTPHFKLELHGDTLAASDAFKEISTTPEFAAWRTKHP